MAFFEDIGKRLSNAGQGMANMGDINRLNSAIAEKEKQIVQLHTAIGAAYCEKHADDPEAESIELIRQIADLRQDIVKTQQEINVLRGIVKCPQCGAEQPITSAFCNICGSALPKYEPPKPPEPIVCPSCGKPHESTGAFCTYCGSPIPKDAPSAPAAECPSCHRPIKGTEAFCTYCGTRL